LSARGRPGQLRHRRDNGGALHDVITSGNGDTIDANDFPFL
jgi:hypothetical protein